MSPSTSPLAKLVELARRRPVVGCTCLALVGALLGAVSVWGTSGGDAIDQPQLIFWMCLWAVISAGIGVVAARRSRR